MSFDQLTTGEKIEFEESVLSIGRGFLPPCAIAVLDGDSPSDQYWRFLAHQWELSAQDVADEGDL